MDTYGVWDLVYRFLLPDWWIIPLYSTVTAWIATVSWWRRAIRLGSAWAGRLLLVVQNGSAARRLAVRGALAAPFFVVPVVAMLWWYVLGGVIWSAFAGMFGGDDDFGPNPLTIAATLCAAAAIFFAGRAEDETERWLVAFGFGLVVGVPLVLIASFGLLVGLLSVLSALVFGAQPAAWELIWIGTALTGAALLATVAVWAGAWATRTGIELVASAAPAAPRP